MEGKGGKEGRKVGMGERKIGKKGRMEREKGEGQRGARSGWSLCLCYWASLPSQF